MSPWYYADRQRQQQGPLPVAELARLFREGRIDAATLVWRDGLASWQPLGSVRAELGLDDRAPGPEAGPADPGAAVPASGPAPAGAEPAATPAAWAFEPAVAAARIVHAGLWRRFAASVIDGLVTGILTYALLIPLLLAFGFSLSSLAMTDLGHGYGYGFLALNYGVGFGLPALYFAWMHSSGTQASLGKMAVGIRLVRGNGEPVGFLRALLRYLAYLLLVLFTCGIGVLVSGLMVAFTERRQAPHDMLCDTLVVDRWAFTDHPQWQRQGLDPVTIGILVLVGLAFLAGLLGAVAVIGLLAAK